MSRLHNKEANVFPETPPVENHCNVSNHRSSNFTLSMNFTWKSNGLRFQRAAGPPPPPLCVCGSNDRKWATKELMSNVTSDLRVSAVGLLQSGCPVQKPSVFAVAVQTCSRQSSYESGWPDMRFRFLGDLQRFFWEWLIARGRSAGGVRWPIKIWIWIFVGFLFANASHGWAAGTKVHICSKLEQSFAPPWPQTSGTMTVVWYTWEVNEHIDAWINK